MCGDWLKLPPFSTNRKIGAGYWMKDQLYLATRGSQLKPQQICKGGNVVTSGPN